MANNYTLFLTAYHGNADYIVNEDGTPNTAHSKNLVPLFVMDNKWHGKTTPGKPGDIPPIIFIIIKLPVPKEMTGNVLIQTDNN